MSADAAVSLGVVVAALAMRMTGWLWLDPTVSLVIVVVIAVGTWDLLKHSLDLAMDAVPPHIDPQNVESYLAGLPGISAVHDPHIWGMSTTEVALTVHLVKPDAQIEDALLARTQHDLSLRGCPSSEASAQSEENAESFSTLPSIMLPNHASPHRVRFVGARSPSIFRKGESHASAHAWPQWA